MARRLTGVLVVVCGCVSLPPAEQGDGGNNPCEGLDVGNDSDGDGYTHCVQDCIDGDAAIHPGAREICEDQIDQDCDGIDLACVDHLEGNTAPAGELWTVSNEALAITFDRGPANDGLTGPIGLRSRVGSDTQLLMTATEAADRYWAVTRWPNVFSWRSNSTAPVFQELVVGDAVVRARSGWADGAGNGTSTFTIYPDGRIHRRDEVSVLASSDVYLTTYVSLNPSRVDRADWDGPMEPTAPVPLDIDTGTTYEPHIEGTSTSYVCMFHSVTGDRVVFTSQPTPAFDGQRALEARRSGVPLAGMSFDWQRGEAVVAGDYEADTMIHVGAGSGQRPCSAVAPYVSAFRAPPTLTRLPTPSPDPAPVFVQSSGSYDVLARGLSLQLALSAPVPSLALHVLEVPNAHNPIVERGAERLVRGRDYHLQHGDDDVWLVIVDGVGQAGVTVAWP